MTYNIGLKNLKGTIYFNSFKGEQNVIMSKFYWVINMTQQNKMIKKQYQLV